MTEPLVTIDDAHDRSRASDGISRYGAYLRNSIPEFRDSWNGTVAGPVQFAAAAWRNATGPIMGPGYAEIRADINGIRITAGESGDGDYAIEVTIPLTHRALKPLFPSRLGLPDFGDWHREGSPFSDHKGFWDPKYTRPALLTTTRLLIPLTDTMLPTPDDNPADVVSLTDAKASVRAVADIVNRQAGPIVEALRSAPVNAPTMFEGWWEVPDGLVLASQLAAMDLPRIPGGPVAGIVQAENWHAYGRDDNFRLYRLAESQPSTASAAQLEAADAKRTKTRVYRCEECRAFSEQALPRYPLDDLLLKDIAPRRLCACCRHITRLTGYQAHYGGRRAGTARWAAKMAAPGGALAVTAAEVRPEGTTASGKRHPITGIAVLAFDIADGRKAFDATVLRRPAKTGQKTKGQLNPEPGAAKLHAAIDGRTLIGWRKEDLEPLRPILAPNSRHTALGEEAHTRITDWRGNLDVRTGRPRGATSPGRPDRLALLIRRIADTTPGSDDPAGGDGA